MLHRFHSISQRNCMKTIRNSRTNRPFPPPVFNKELFLTRNKKGEIPPLFFEGESHRSFLKGTLEEYCSLPSPKVFLRSRDKRPLGLGRKVLGGSGDSPGAGGRNAALLFPSVSGMAASLLMQLMSCAGQRIISQPVPPVSKEFIQVNSTTSTHRLLKLNL